MDPLRSWLAACRPDQALLAPLCVAVGSSYAHFDVQTGAGRWAELVVAFSAFVAALGVNLIDHAWARLGAPQAAPTAQGSSAPRPLDAKESAAAGAAAIALAVLCGLGLVPLSGAAALGYGAFALFLAVARGAPLVGFDTLGWGLGELATVVAFGPMAAMAGFASQTGAGSSGAFLAGLPAGLVAVAALHGGRAGTPKLDAAEERRRAVAFPLLAAAAVAIAVRAGEYGRLADIAILPMAVAAAAAWRPLSPSPHLDPVWRERLPLVCSIAALCAIAAALRIASPA